MSTACFLAIRSVNKFKVTSRCIFTSQVVDKIIPNNLKGKSTSSQEWLKRQLNDPYVKEARYKNYRSRAAFKLIEMDDKYKLIKQGMRVVELGAAPGSWTQVLVERLGLDSSGGKHVSKNNSSLVVSIDLNPINPIEGAFTLGNCDFTKSINQGRILSVLDSRTAHMVVSDMAPNCTGHHSLDYEAIRQLIFAALTFSVQVLEPAVGIFLFKIWDGSNDDQLFDHLRKLFARVDRVKPPASRVDSSESYVLCRSFKGINK